MEALNFSCQRPYALYGLVLLVPALIISVFQFKKAHKNLKFFTVKDKSSVVARRMKNFALMYGIRTFCAKFVGFCTLRLSFFRELQFILSFKAYFFPLFRV